MRSSLRSALALAFALGASSLALANDSGKTAFAFDGTGYYYRWQLNDPKTAAMVGQVEYTPNGQSDLNKWTDMVTFVQYKKVKTASVLDKTARAVLAEYSGGGGDIIGTMKTKSTPPEFFIAAVLPGEGLREAVFARIRLYHGTGLGVIYSHRTYGTQAQAKIAPWMRQNGKATQTRLMGWDVVPAPPPAH